MKTEEKESLKSFKDDTKKGASLLPKRSVPFTQKERPFFITIFFTFVALYRQLIICKI
jgi:hypothetical protein